MAMISSSGRKGTWPETRTWIFTSPGQPPRPKRTISKHPTGGQARAGPSLPLSKEASNTPGSSLWDSALPPTSAEGTRRSQDPPREGREHHPPGRRRGCHLLIQRSAGADRPPKPERVQNGCLSNMTFLHGLPRLHFRVEEKSDHAIGRIAPKTHCLLRPGHRQRCQEGSDRVIHGTLPKGQRSRHLLHHVTGTGLGPQAPPEHTIGAVRYVKSR